MAKCALCKSSKEDVYQYGDILRQNDLTVHTFCLYLSSNLSQRGNEDEGFCGFLPEDIRKEQRRICKLTCCYCSKRYANIGCCNVHCRRSFHLICGIENGAENEFVNTFNSYCHEHVRKHYGRKPSRGEECCICYDKLIASGKRFNKVNMLLAPCCKNKWFHKLCVQKFAMSAGYFFKCPLCNDAEIFCKELRYRGIFIPERDAAWELEPNAFFELLERPNSCAADNCHSARGRTKTSSKNPLLLCNACGSVAMHKKCLPERANQFLCTDCNLGNDSGRASFHSRNRNSTNDDSDEVLDVDVEEYSDDSVLKILVSDKLADKSQNVPTEEKEESKTNEEFIEPLTASDNSEVIQSYDDSVTSSTKELIQCSQDSKPLGNMNCQSILQMQHNKENTCRTKFLQEKDDQESSYIRDRFMRMVDSIFIDVDATKSCSEDTEQSNRKFESMPSKAMCTSKNINSPFSRSKKNSQINYVNSKLEISKNKVDDGDESKPISFESKRRKTRSHSSSSDEFKMLSPHNASDSFLPLRIENEQFESVDELKEVISASFSPRPCRVIEDVEQVKEKNMDRKKGLKQGRAHRTAAKRIRTSRSSRSLLSASYHSRSSSSSSSPIGAPSLTRRAKFCVKRMRICSFSESEQWS